MESRRAGRILSRLLVASHFVYELVDKNVRYNHWKGVIADAGIGEWSLILIIVLLLIGSFTVVLGRDLWFGLFCLSVFQIPTSLMFEDSLYESFDSMSALGGVLAVTLLHMDPPTLLEVSHHSDDLVSYSYMRREDPEEAMPSAAGVQS